MQQTFKILCLKFYRISFFYKMIAIFLNSIIVLFFLSSCSTIFQKPLKNYLINQETIKKNNKIDNFKKYHYKIGQKKQKLLRLLCASGVNLNQIFKIIKTDLNLNNLKNGQILSWTVNSSGKLLELTWKISNFQKKIYKNVNNNFFISNVISKDTIIKKNVLIKKQSNFFHSAIQSGLKKYEINNVIQAIERQIDFQKLNIGTKFNLIFSHDLKNNKNILLGVKVNNCGKKYYSIRSSDGSFYDPYSFNYNQCPINTSFLKKYRVSSQFNLKRLNPVTHRIAHHFGVDLAMPQGTPVLATSNGEIIQARFNKIAGFYITLKNKEYYITRYMHLKKILVKIGEKVKLGQKIALSGNTGRTTGPHLHYEIWMNRHAVDPMKFRCILHKKIKTKEKKIYSEQLQEILTYLQ